MNSGTKIVLVALAAGALGVVASIVTNGPGPLLGTEAGQRVVQEAYKATAPATPPGVAVAGRGDTIPAFTVPGLDGTPVDVSTAWAGKPMLINIWASWCGPCIEEMPELQRFHAKQGANGVQVVGIALDDVDAVRDFLQRVPVDYPILVDAAGPADAGVRLGNPKGVLPYSVLVAADGTVLKQRIGPFEHGEIDGWARFAP